MKVKILVNVAGRGFAYSPGEVVTLPKELGEEFVRVGHAELVKEKKTATNKVRQTR